MYVGLRREKVEKVEIGIGIGEGQWNGRVTEDVIIAGCRNCLASLYLGPLEVICSLTILPT